MFHHPVTRYPIIFVLRYTTLYKFPVKNSHKYKRFISISAFFYVLIRSICMSNLTYIKYKLGNLLSNYVWVGVGTIKDINICACMDTCISVLHLYLIKLFIFSKRRLSFTYKQEQRNDIRFDKDSLISCDVYHYSPHHRWLSS